MALPTQKTQADRSLQNKIIVMYGRAKIGKSTLASQFPKPLFLATEPGLDFLETFRVNIFNWKDFLSNCAEIAEGNHDYQTIVIDTIDNLVGYCNDYVCAREKMDHPSDMPMGKGWHLVTRELHKKLHKLAMLPYTLIMISHCKLITIEEPARKHTRWSIPIGGENRNVILNLADMILFLDSRITNEKEVRLIRTKPSRAWEAGDRSNKLPAELPLSYGELSKYFE